MALTFDYSCSHCGKWSTNYELNSFSCDCGGYYNLMDGAQMRPAIFDAYYDTSVEKYLTSYREQEKEGKKYRSKSHPEGLSIYQDTKFFKEKMYVRKHKEDFLQGVYKQKGIKYIPGVKYRHDAEKDIPVPVNRSRTVYSYAS